MAIIKRNKYLNRIIKFLDKGVIIVLVGQRRVGKSFMLKQVEDYINDNINTSNVIFINKENIKFDNIKNYLDLYNYVDNLIDKNKKNYLLIDEVQDIENFEKALRSLNGEDKCQIIITGSNAKMLSSELSTLISGRYIEIDIHSLSYLEYLEFHKKENNEESLKQYLTIGGLPGLSKIGVNDISMVEDYLKDVYNTIVFRDIIYRENIRNITFLENLLKYIGDNIGKNFSIANIVNYCKSNQNQDVSNLLINNYLRYYINSYLISLVKRYDVNGKKIFENKASYYFEDLGLRNLLCGFNIRANIEKLIENAIYNHLIINGYDVKIGCLRAGEIDFIAKKQEETIYIQATYLLGSQETIEREFGILSKINDNYPKYVISMDPVTGQLPEYPGIIHISLRDFLSK